MDWDNLEDPSELARVLWKEFSEAATLPTTDFLRHYDRVLASSKDIKDLSLVGGAADFYLRRNPKAFQPATELIEALLSSRQIDARMTGLKLSVYGYPQDKFFSEIVRALKSRQEDIRGTALFAMGRFFDENSGVPIDVPDTLVRAVERGLLNCECPETDSSLGVDSRRWARSLREQFLEARA